jgi:hypothetical protein
MDVTSPAKYCSSCRTKRPVNEFKRKANGDIYDTCAKHSRVSDTETLEDLFSQLPNQGANGVINIEKKWIYLEDLDPDKSDKERCDIIANYVYHKLGYKFNYKTKHEGRTSNLSIEYICAQRRDTASRSSSTGKRDSFPMERYDCGGRLRIRTEGQNHYSVTLYHKPHQRYTDHSTAEEIRQFVGIRTEKSPQEVYELLKVSELQHLAVNTTIKQISYWWTEATKGSWQRDKDYWHRPESSLLRDQT